MKYYKTFFFVLLLASCTSGTKSDDNRQNVKLLWRNPNLEWITSSQLIKNSTIYFGSFNGKFYSADIANGEPKLQFQTGGDPYYLPIVNNNRIIFSSFDLNIYCIDTLGSLVWKIPTEDRIKNDLIEDDSLFFASVRGDGLHALRKSDGSAVWHLDQSSSSFSTSQPIMHLDKIYVGAWDEKVLAINKKSGQVIWTTEYPEYSSSDPAISPMGLIISIDKYYEGGQVKMLDFNTGNEIWSVSLKCESLYKPFTDNENVIISTYDNKIVCLDNTSGKIKWTLNLPNEENADTDISLFNGNIYFGTTLRNLYCVNIETGKTVFKESFNYGLSVPTVVGDKIYFPTGHSELWTLK